MIEVTCSLECDLFEAEKMKEIYIVQDRLGMSFNSFQIFIFDAL